MRVDTNHRTSVVAFALSLLAASPAVSAERFWSAPGGGNFDDMANWDDGTIGVPGAADVTVFDLAASYEVGFSSPVATERTLVRRGVVTFDFLPPGVTYELLGTSPAAAGVVVGVETGDTAELTVVFGSLAATYATIADAPGSTAGLTLVGPIARIALNGDLGIGARGTGFFDLIDGASASSQRVLIGRNAGAYGAATISGAIAVWTVDAEFIVGAHGTGGLEVGDFGRIDSGDGIIAQNENAFGDVVVGGLLAGWTIAGTLDVGMNGAGTLNVERGGVVDVGGLCTIGTFPSLMGLGDGGVGIVRVSGMNTLFVVADDLYVGYLSDGALAIDHDGRVIVGNDLIINRADEALDEPVTIEIASSLEYVGTPAIEVGGIVDADPGLDTLRLVLADGFMPVAGDAFDLVSAAGGIDTIGLVTPELTPPLVWVPTTAAGLLRAYVAECPGADCNRNGIGDACEIEFGVSLDCNDNGVPDTCDILDGTSADCDLNGVPDECDIASGLVDDCNENGVPDGCEVTSLVSASSGPLGPIGGDSPQAFSLVDPPVSLTDVTLHFTAVADLGSTAEFVDVFIDGEIVATIFVDGGIDCVEVETTVVVDADGFNEAGADGLVTIDMVASDSVSEFLCADSRITVDLQYAELGDNDANENGVPDDCECVADLDGDGLVGFDDLLLVLSSWGPCAGCAADLDDDGTVGFDDLLLVLSVWGACP